MSDPTGMHWEWFGRDLDRMMKFHRYSTRTLGQYLGISKATLSRVCRGADCNVEHFLKLCRWMNTDPMQYLLGRPLS